MCYGGAGGEMAGMGGGSGQQSPAGLQSMGGAPWQNMQRSLGSMMPPASFGQGGTMQQGPMGGAGFGSTMPQGRFDQGGTQSQSPTGYAAQDMQARMAMPSPMQAPQQGGGLQAQMGKVDRFAGLGDPLANQQAIRQSPLAAGMGGDPNDTWSMVMGLPGNAELLAKMSPEQIAREKAAMNPNFGQMMGAQSLFANRTKV